MSVVYQAVHWNRQKKLYDILLWAFVSLYLFLFVGLSFFFYPQATVETVLIRAFGTGALLLLHVILSIGPLCRLFPLFYPLLYNRRHMGVTLFFLALAHSFLSWFQHHFWGNLNPFLSLLTSREHWDSVAHFPFQLLGLGAFVIFLLMAVTSHDFWLKNLSPYVWKSLHMGVYFAYSLVVLHVALGILQAPHSVVLSAFFVVGFVWIFGLHVFAGVYEWRKELFGSRTQKEQKDFYVKACRPEDIQEGCAKVVRVGDEQVAVFKYDGQVSAIGHVCAHQNGPLGEGRVVDGCVTCPWHGYQYRPADGMSPPPFKEKVPTYGVKLENGWIWVALKANAPGTFVEPVFLNGEKGHE